MRAKVVRCVLNTGSNGIRIAEGPLCWPSVIALLHFTMVYLVFRESPSVKSVRPLGLQNRQRVEILRERSLRRRPSAVRLPRIIVLVSRMNIAARGGACAASRIPEPRGLHRLAT